MCWCESEHPEQTLYRGPSSPSMESGVLQPLSQVCRGKAMFSSKPCSGSKFGALPTAYALLLAVLFWSSFGYAQNLSLQVDQVDLREFPQIKLFVTASNVDGAPVMGLESGAFEVSEDGTAVSDVAVQRFLESGEGLSVVLAIDVSGSMRGAPIENARDAARTFISKLNPQDRVAVVTFGDAVAVETGFADDRTTAYARVGEIKATGRKTIIFDGVHESIKRLSATNLPVRKSIVVLSDGRDEGSAVTLEDCVAAAGEQNIQVSTVGLGQMGERPLKTLRRMSRLTEGAFLQAKRPQDLSIIYATLADRLRNSYVVSFEAKTIVADGTEHSVKVGAKAMGEDVQAVEQFIVARALKATEDNSLEEGGVPDGGGGLPDEEPGGRPTWFWVAVGGGALAVVAILVVLFFVFLRKKKCEECDTELDPETGECPRCAAERAETARRAKAKAQAQARPIIGSALPAQAPMPAPIPKAPSIAALIVRAGAQKGMTFEMYDESVLVGREMDSCQIIIEDEAISRVHFNIQLTSGYFSLTDMNSSFGTKLNGNPVTETLGLENNDVITVGDTELLFQDRR